MVSKLGIGAGIGIPFRNIASGGGKPYLPPELKASLRVVAIDYGKTNSDPDRAIIKNLVDPDNPLIISNAAFKLNSGHGLYAADFLNWSSPNGVQKTSFEVKLPSDYKEHWVAYNPPNTAFKAMKVRISGIPDGGTLQFFRTTADGGGIKMVNGINEIPAFTNTVAAGFYIDIPLGFDWSNLVITQIPQYEGAFVTDGIDDLIMSTKTIQEILDGSSEITVVSMWANLDDTKNRVNVIRDDDNSYCQNLATTDSLSGKYYITGYSGGITSTPNIVSPLLGDKADWRVQSLSAWSNSKFSVEGFRKSNGVVGEVSKVAWYWTIIANKVLTTDDINLIIAYYNLDRCIEPTVWYDTIKQGLSNSTPDSEWYLKDFSKNGYDMQLFNFAKKLNSGIGEYKVDYTSWSIGQTTADVTPSKIELTKEGTLVRMYSYASMTQNVPSFNIKLSNLKQGYIRYWYRTESGTESHIDLTQDGTYTLPVSYKTNEGTGSNGGFNSNGTIINIGTTIEQIPSHEGALVTDGVSDYGKVSGLPAYKDYTVVTDYQRLSIGYIEGKGTPAILSKSYTANQGAFLMNLIGSNGAHMNTYTFGAANANTYTDLDRQIYWQTKYKMQGFDTTIGEGVDGDSLWLALVRDNDSRFFNGAFYSLMLFPYSMSEFLIERQLKKHKLGTLYPDMVEWRPIIKSNSEYTITAFSGSTPMVIGSYYPINTPITFHVKPKGLVDEVVKLTINGKEMVFNKVSGTTYIYDYSSLPKSPQKIDITIDEYIRFEDIVQPYPAILSIPKPGGGNYTFGEKIPVGYKFNRSPLTNLLGEFYSITGFWLNDILILSGEEVTVSKTMVCRTRATWIATNTNAPKCILSPSRLRIPNSSYKILGYIPDLSGNRNHGKINNSAYAEGSGVNADGSYQLDGVDDFITIPTTVGGKQVIMKVIWDDVIADAILYDQRGYPNEFAIYNADNDNSGNPVTAYQARNNGKTYIDGILNSNIKASELKNVNHIITITNELPSGANGTFPIIGSNRVNDAYFTKMALYDFMLFDEISTDEEIATLNEYIGIEPKITIPDYYWDAYGKANNDANDIEGNHTRFNNKVDNSSDYQLVPYNFAWDLMSGYGGYNFANFENSLEWYNTMGNDSIDIVSRKEYSIILKRLTNTEYWRFQNGMTTTLSMNIPFKVKADKPITVCWDCHGTKEDGSITSKAVTWTKLESNKDTLINLGYLTEEELAEQGIVNNVYYILWFDLSAIAIDEEVTIEMLPLYPNGLCLDGVDDYLFNANIPAFTDYTYILKRKLLNNVLDSCSLYKGTTYINGGRAFIADYYNSDDKFTGYSFGNAVTYDINEDDLFVYGTKTSVNGNTVVPGLNGDEAGIIIGHWIDKYKQMVFYKLLLYPKTLPVLEINYLKNMLAREEIIDLSNPIFK